MIFNMTNGGGYTLPEIASRSVAGSITIPNATVGSMAFGYCTGITSINCPSATTIYNYAFQGCTYLTSISIPNATVISNYAFYLCSRLTTASCPKVTTVNAYAFANCSVLKTVSFPSVTSIGSYAFRSCWSLTSLSFPKALRVYSNAFLDCSNISIIRFNSYVSLIQSSVFWRCVRLVSLYLTGVSSVPTLSANAFSSTPIGGYSTTAGKYGSVYVPSSLLSAFKSAANWSVISARIVAG